MQAFRGVLGVAVRLCRPADPEAKGLVERANGYLETSFLPGRVFTSPADFNAQLSAWLVRANGRVHRSIDARPADRWEPDRAAMVGLPPVAPLVGWRASVRLPRDHYVRIDANDYSVDPGVVGRRVEVTADLEQVRVFCAGRQVAGHDRCWAGWTDHHRPRSPRRCGATAPSPPACPGSDNGNRGAATESGRLRPDHRGGGGGLMATKTSNRNVAAELAYLTRTPKAPSLAAAVDRLAERARVESWTHEEFLAACLQREVAARESHGGEARIRTARFPARKALEDFDFDHQRSLKRDTIAHLGTLDFVAAKENVVFLGPPGTGKTHLSIGLGIRACQAGHRVAFATAAEWVARLAWRTTPAGYKTRSPSWAGSRC
jgi:hypothetical protein